MDTGRPQDNPSNTPPAGAIRHVHSLRGRAGCIQTWLQMRQRRVEIRTRLEEAKGRKFDDDARLGRRRQIAAGDAATVRPHGNSLDTRKVHR